MPTRRAAIAGLTALTLLICYASTLRGMFNQWQTDEDMSHGFVVPLVVAWIVWRERARWLAEPVSPSWWGFLLLAGAAARRLMIAAQNAADSYARSMRKAAEEKPAKPIVKKTVKKTPKKAGNTTAKKKNG